MFRNSYFLSDNGRRGSFRDAVRSTNETTQKVERKASLQFRTHPSEYFFLLLRRAF